MDNSFSPSIHCRAVASKAKRILFMIRRGKNCLTRSFYTPSLFPQPPPHPQLRKPFMLVLVLTLSPPRRLRADLILAFKIFKGEVDLNSSEFFLRPPRAGLRGHTYRLMQGPSRLRRRSGAFSVRVVKYWNRLPAHLPARSNCGTLPAL